MAGVAGKGFFRTLGMVVGAGQRCMAIFQDAFSQSAEEAGLALGRTSSRGSRDSRGPFSGGGRSPRPAGPGRRSNQDKHPGPECGGVGDRDRGTESDDGGNSCS